MTNEEKKELKIKILRLIATCEEDILEIEKMTQPVSPENAIGRVSRMDAINNKSVMEAALRNKRNKLTQLKIAAEKISEENFGLCKFCGQAIQPARLIYMPESSRCIRCADKI